MFQCGLAKYDEGTEVVFYELTNHESQKFIANKDGTISPVMAPGVVMGMETTCMDHDAEQ